MHSKKITISGQVQGVGFRPFIYRIAHEHNLKGHVINQTGTVVIICQGNETDIENFTRDIVEQAPPLAKPFINQVIDLDEVEPGNFENFTIHKSEQADKADIHIPPDYFTCNDCLEEMTDVTQRRYQYPFTNCTQCGPRYTIIDSLPYDRVNTSMAEFKLCPSCHSEYTNPLDRRFHAQPLACPECGPSLRYKSKSDVIDNDNNSAIDKTIDDIKQGKIVAVKGVGGYHLVCDAANQTAIKTLRERKQRPAKPLAVMFPAKGEDGLELIIERCNINEQEADLLSSPERPIVLVSVKATSRLPDNIAPGLKQLGVFLPYSPLHHLLLSKFNKPLIATSGNISGEPVIIDADMAETKLTGICDSFLHHNRPILRPADDSVKRIIHRHPMLIRGGRGKAPIELELPYQLDEPVLAVGGHLKNTVALAWDKRLVISPHISDLDSNRGFQVFQQVIEDLQRLYQVTANTIIHDAHPGYQSTRWAKLQNKPTKAIWHHHAHAGTVAGQHPEIKNWLMFCWDGVGLGDDQSLWGGETFYGQAGNWQRVASFKPFYLPGADKAGREPWRSACALLWESGFEKLPEIDNAELAYQAWQKKMNCPQSSAAGRLFDAASCLVLGIDKTSFEGQGPMQLEALAETVTQSYTGTSNDFIDLPLIEQANRHCLIDWQPLLEMLQDKDQEPASRSIVFHNSMAHSIIKQAELFKEKFQIDAIGLSGGVFQNKVLVEKIFKLAARNNLTFFLPKEIPVNDGGLSYGQIIEFAGCQLPVTG